MSSPAWVLDTNVLVSGLINPHGHPGRLMDAVLGGHLELALDDRIYSEYAEVLQRPKFKLTLADIRNLLAFIERQHWISAHPLEIANIPDPSDLPFAEVALSLADPVLVTGNPKHFPVKKLKGLRVLTPQQAWVRLVETRT